MNKRIKVYESVVNYITCDGKKLYIYDKLSGLERTMPVNDIYKKIYKEKLCTK